MSQAETSPLCIRHTEGCIWKYSSMHRESWEGHRSVNLLCVCMFLLWCTCFYLLLCLLPWSIFLWAHSYPMPESREYFSSEEFKFFITRSTDGIVKHGYQATAFQPPNQWRCWLEIQTQISSHSRFLLCMSLSVQSLCWMDSSEV